MMIHWFTGKQIYVASWVHSKHEDEKALFLKILAK